MSIYYVHAEMPKVLVRCNDLTKINCINVFLDICIDQSLEFKKIFFWYILLFPLFNNWPWFISFPFSFWIGALCRSRNSALASLKCGNKKIAIKYAKELKLTSQSRERCTTLLDRVENVLQVIMDAESSKKVGWSWLYDKCNIAFSLVICDMIDLGIICINAWGGL